MSISFEVSMLIFIILLVQTNHFVPQGEQWAPVYHNSSPSNYWVMIGQKYQNSATTCMDNWELEGHSPNWGLSDERADLKKYIMCCLSS